MEKSLGYLEQVSLSILQNPNTAQPSLIDQVCILADRLKYYDPVEDLDVLEGDADNSRLGNTWLRDLEAIQQDYSVRIL